MINYVYRLFWITIKNIFILMFYIFVGFFMLPIVLYILFIYLSNMFTEKYRLLLTIFVIINISIAVFIGISVDLWLRGSISDISFNYVLYNIMRNEFMYLIPVWVFSFTLGIIQLLRIKEIWNEWVSWSHING